MAYADFVTAMMALFMVLWLTSQSEEDREEMAQFFQDPYNTPLDASMGVMPQEGRSRSETEGQKKGKAKVSDLKVLLNMAQAFMELLNVDSADP